MSNLLYDAGVIYGEHTYDELPTSDQAIIAFGMTPIHICDKATEYVREELARSYAENLWHDVSKWEDALRGLKPGVEEPFVKGVCVGLMRKASSKGRMMV